MITSYLIAFGITILFTAPIAYLWVRSIDYMKKNHPDYKGEEFLNWDRKNDGWDGIKDNWDDNKNHTEGPL